MKPKTIEATRAKLIDDNVKKKTVKDIVRRKKPVGKAVKARVLIGKKVTYKNANIYQKLSWVSEQVQYVKKDEHISFGNTDFWASSHDQVTATVQPFLVEAGIVVVPTLVESEVHLEMLQTEKQKGDKRVLRNEFLYRGRYKVTFVNIDKPEDFTYWIGEAFSMDSSDKHTGIAESYAVKRAILKVLSLETGETDEGRFDSDNRITEQQAKTLDGAIAGNVDITQMLLRFFKMGERGLDQLPASKFDQCLELVSTFNVQRAKKQNGKGVKK